jgi:hypothetical protein
MVEWKVSSCSMSSLCKAAFFLSSFWSYHEDPLITTSLDPPCPESSLCCSPSDMIKHDIKSTMSSRNGEKG